MVLALTFFAIGWSRQRPETESILTEQRLGSLPAAPERLDQHDARIEPASLNIRGRQLRLERRRLGTRDIQISHCTGAVAMLGLLQRDARRRDRGGDRLRLLLQLPQRREAILHVLVRREYSVAIVRNLLSVLRLGAFGLCHQPPALENR